MNTLRYYNDYQLIFDNNCIIFEDLKKGRHGRISYKNVDFIEFNTNNVNYLTEVVIQLINPQIEFNSTTIELDFFLWVDAEVRALIDFANKKVDGYVEPAVVTSKPKATPSNPKTATPKKANPKAVFDKTVEDAEKLLALKNEYAKTEKQIKNLKDELNPLQAEIGKLDKPTWTWTTVGMATGATYIHYYGDYKPVAPFMYVLLFTPFNPIAAIVLIVNKCKKSKCKKKLKVALDEYNTKHNELSQKIAQLEAQISKLQSNLDNILQQANELK